MRDLSPAFQFDVSELIGKAQRHSKKRVDGVTINLPFVSFSIRPDDLEKKVAREVVIRLADKRILNAFECCDSCVEQALASLQDIRSLLVDKQVELVKLTGGPLYLLIEMMVEAIRQFLTFEQRLKKEQGHDHLALPISKGLVDLPGERGKYFAALEMLRAHLHRCLIQVAKIAGTSIPKISDHMRYDEAWQLEAYEKLALEGNRDD